MFRVHGFTGSGSEFWFEVRRSQFGVSGSIAIAKHVDR